ncbi:hypothetical protein BHQ18_09385 [Mycolicibacterium flavescens]|uniref:Uncharacterized protein n=1 Tax=Mycolicibacterium flavescens TaxID=1776 RepID=A0A1E3RM17_MYCFV|nr:hypothetical protein BHQ18_09385 [Mycolicibacterium flavescens]
MIGGDVVDVWAVGERAGRVDRPAGESLGESGGDVDRLTLARDTLIEIAGDDRGGSVIHCGQPSFEAVEVVQML